jgi:hypothetical protein
MFTKPTASLQIDGLNINKTDLGLLNFIEGNQSLDKFTINSYLENGNLESFNVNGSFCYSRQANYSRFKNTAKPV